MKQYFTKSFFRFLFGFLAIIGAAFLLLVILAHESPEPVDNIAQPQ